MPDTLQGLFVAALGLLPGALYVWSFEQIVGRWGIGLSDRVLRFIGISALFQAAFLPALYTIWSSYVRTGRIQDGHAPLVLWPVALLYVSVPLLAGRAVARGMLAGSRIATIVTGPDPAPRAWDHFFSAHPVGWIRIRLKSGVWVGGLFDTSEEPPSYAAGYPEGGDLYLSRTVDIDRDTGEFVFDEDGEPMLRESGILVRWDEIEYLVFREG